MRPIDAIEPNLQGLKRLARDLGIPVVALVQLKGSINEDVVRRPNVADLWNGPAVERNADVLMFVHRPEYMLRRREPEEGSKEHADWAAKVASWEGKAEFILGKRRGGVGWGSRTAGFDAARYRFHDNLNAGLFKEADIVALL